MKLSDEELSVMAEELGDCSDLNLSLKSMSETMDVTVEDLASGMRMWANHVKEEHGEFQ